MKMIMKIILIKIRKMRSLRIKLIIILKLIKIKRMKLIIQIMKIFSWEIQLKFLFYLVYTIIIQKVILI